MNSKLHKAGLGIATAALLMMTVSCADVSGQPGRPRTMAQMVGTCIAVTAGGAVVGALVGKGKGAAIGAGVGAAACTVFMAFNNAADKKRIADAEAKAAETRRAQRDAWADGGNQAKGLSVQVIGDDQTVQAQNSAPTICRTVQTSLTMNGTGANSVQQVYCRAPDGSWKTKEALGLV